MSNSIWKTPDQKPDIDKQILVKNDFDYIIYFGKCAVAPKNKWAYIDELLAQAGKAERAIWWLKEIVENHRYTPITTAEMALKELDGANKRTCIEYVIKYRGDASKFPAPKSKDKIRKL